MTVLGKRGSTRSKERGASWYRGRAVVCLPGAGGSWDVVACYVPVDAIQAAALPDRFTGVPS